MFRLIAPCVTGVLFVLAAHSFAADLDIKGSTPSIAADGDLVAVVTAEPNSLACAVSHDGGVTFAAPAPVGKVAEGQMLGMRRGPQIAVGGNTIVIATNNSKGGRIVAFCSTDAGKSWQGGTPVDNPPGRSSEGLLSMTSTRDGFAVVFLELVENSMQIGLIQSTDHGKSWQDSRVIYASPAGHVCECCQPTIASNRAGYLTVMFRNWLDGNRDMYMVTSKDDGATFGKAAKLGSGSWKLDACPMDGGGLTYGNADKTQDKAIAKGPLAVFRRESTLYTARVGEVESKVGPGKSAVIAATAEGPVLAWEAPTGVTLRVPKSADLTIAGARAPVLTATSRGVLLAYTTREGSEDKTEARLVWQAKAR